MRTLFPGGVKRPEIKVPALVLELSSADVLDSEDCLAVVDAAVRDWAGIVVLEGGEESGGRLYEAARMLKSAIRDRAYFLISERVDVAAAVGSSGVVLSDQGLRPSFVVFFCLLVYGFFHRKCVNFDLIFYCFVVLR